MNLLPEMLDLPSNTSFDYMLATREYIEQHGKPCIAVQ